MCFEVTSNWPLDCGIDFGPMLDFAGKLLSDSPALRYMTLLVVLVCATAIGLYLADAFFYKDEW